MKKSIWNHCSIIIPCHNQEDKHLELIHDLKHFAQNSEILLVSPKLDLLKLRPIFDSLNIKHIPSPLGRAKQLNLGAKTATRRFLWFLHADTRIETTSQSALTHLRDIDKNSIYYFRLKFQTDGPKRCQLNALGANIRSSLFKLPFGDQSYLLSKSIYQKIEGFDETKDYAEDFDFIKRARQSRISIKGLPISISTSARKYHNNGWAPTTLKHLNYVLRNW